MLRPSTTSKPQSPTTHMQHKSLASQTCFSSCTDPSLSLDDTKCRKSGWIAAFSPASMPDSCPTAARALRDKRIDQLAEMSEGRKNANARSISIRSWVTTALGVLLSFCGSWTSPSRTVHPRCFASASSCEESRAGNEAAGQLMKWTRNTGAGGGKARETHR